MPHPKQIEYQGATYLSVGLVARELDVSPATVRRLCDQGSLHGVRNSSGVRYVDPNSLEAYQREEWRPF